MAGRNRNGNAVIKKGIERMTCQGQREAREERKGLSGEPGTQDVAVRRRRGYPQERRPNWMNPRDVVVLESKKEVKECVIFVSFGDRQKVVVFGPRAASKDPAANIEVSSCRV